MRQFRGMNPNCDFNITGAALLLDELQNYETLQEEHSFSNVYSLSAWTLLNILNILK